MNTQVSQFPDAPVIVVAFFADRKEIEQQMIVEVPAAVPFEKRLWAASRKIRRLFPEAYNFTEVKTASKMLSVECGGIPEGYEIAAAGY